MVSNKTALRPLEALLKIYIGISLLSHLHAFSTSKLLNARYGTPRLHASQYDSEQLYQDTDCFDLCDGFETVVDIAAAEQVKVAEQVKRTNISYKTRLRAPIMSPPWSNPKPNKCKSCRGHGDLICRFCDETGYLSSMGSSEVVFYAGFGKDCPVCKDGMEVCHDCAGTGYVFSWDVKKKA